MRKAFWRKLVVALAALAAAVGQRSAAHAQEKDGVPAEMKVLHKRIGTWSTWSRAKPAVWTPDGVEAKAEETVELVLKGRCIQGKTRNLTDGSEAIWLETYDVNQKAYRFWYFNSQGVIADSRGKWDPKTNTMTWTHEPQPGVSAIAHWRVVGDDVIEWDMIAKDRSGKVYLDMVGKLTRKQTL